MMPPLPRSVLGAPPEWRRLPTHRFWLNRHPLAPLALPGYEAAYAHPVYGSAVGFPWRGRYTVKVVPDASFDSTSMCPSCALTIRSAM